MRRNSDKKLLCDKNVIEMVNDSPTNRKRILFIFIIDLYYNKEYIFNDQQKLKISTQLQSKQLAWFFML